MAEIKIVLKTTEFISSHSGGYSYSEPKERTTIAVIGVTLEADENGVAAVTADDCRLIARLLNAMAAPNAGR